MIIRPSVAVLNLVAGIALAAATAHPAKPVHPPSLRALGPREFEAIRLLKDYTRKKQVPDPIVPGRPETHAIFYTFEASPGHRDGLSVALRQRGTGAGQAFETTHLVVYWKLGDNPNDLVAGTRRDRVHQILASLDLAAKEGELVAALGSIARTHMDSRTDVAVPAPHQVTVFHNLKHEAVGFEIRNQDEKP